MTYEAVARDLGYEYLAAEQALAGSGKKSTGSAKAAKSPAKAPARRAGR